MAEYYTLLTTIGAARLANAHATRTPVNFAQIAVGDAEYDPAEGQAALVNEVWRGAINDMRVHADNPNWFVIEAVIPEDTGGWFVREVGLFDDAGNLIAIGKYPSTYKPVLASGSARDILIRMILEVGNTADVSLSIDPSIVLATRNYVDTALSEHDAAEDAHADATTETKGFVELATIAEAKAGTDATRAVTPAGVAAAIGDLRKTTLLERLLTAMADGSTGRALDAKPETYADATGIDGALSTGYTHDSAGAFIHNPSSDGTDLVPTMTGYTTPSGTVTESGDYGTGYEGWRAFNDTLSDYWNSGTTTGTLGYEAAAAMEFGSYAITSIGVVNSGHCPQNWTFEGWNGADWDVLDTQAGQIDWGLNEVREFPIAGGPVTYQKVRIVITLNNGSPHTSIAEMELLAPPVASAEMDIISTALEAFAEPTTGFFMALVEPIDAVTYGVDYLASLALDDGTTWEAVAVEKIGTAEIDVSGIATTVDVVYGEVAFATSGERTIRSRQQAINSKYIKVHGLIVDAEA